MAHAFIMEFDGATAEQYDAIMVDMALDGVLPPGALFHAAGPTATGWMVCDIWEDAATFNEFAESKIGPLSAKNGVAPPRRVRTFEGEVRTGAPGTPGLMQVVTLAGVDAAKFAELDSAVLGPERLAPEGCIIHVGGPVGDDWMILDYWTTAEIHDAFIADQVRPAVEAAGDVAPPAIEVVTVHNSLTRVAARS